jgi:hypothetical protein
MDLIASHGRSCSGRGGSRGRAAGCGHDDLHSAGGFQGMEEGDHGDVGGALAAAREVGIAPRRNCVSGELVSLLLVVLVFGRVRGITDFARDVVIASGGVRYRILMPS